MYVFHLLMGATATCAMHLAMTAAPNLTIVAAPTQTGAVQLSTTTNWIDTPNIVSLMDYPEKMLCMIPNFWADHRTSIRYGIDYLHHHGEGIILGPGPANCTRVSCADDSGIYVCNDNPQPISVDLHTVANFTYAIYSNVDCVDPTSYGDNTQGQAFSSYGWNTIVGQLIGGGWC